MSLPELAVTGGGVSDTVGAAAGTLRATVTDNLGRRRSGIAVRFEAQGTAVQGRNGFTNFAADTTSDNGQVGMPVRLGAVAGDRTVVVSVPLYGLSVTAHYVVQPGALAEVLVSPVDTTVTVGAEATLRPQAADRYHNPRPDVLSVAIDDGPLRRGSGPTAVVGTAIGRGSVTASAGAFRATAKISVVPDGEIAAVVGAPFSSPGLPTFVTIKLDGSGFRYLAPLGINGADHPIGVTWSPDGSHLVYVRSIRGSRLTTLALDGTARRFIQRTLPIEGEGWGQFSRDGRWIYYSARPDHQNGVLWRARADGSVPEQIGPDPGYQRVEAYPSPSPDGSRLVYLAPALFSGAGQLTIFDLATRASTDLGIPAESPRWSPTADRIAYVALGVLLSVDNEATGYGELRSVAPDGSGDRAIAPGSYAAGFDWDPTGRYIVARSQNGLVVIDVQAGSVLPLGWSQPFLMPAWRP